MDRKRWIVVSALLFAVFLCLVVLAVGAVLAVKNIPAAARLVYGDPPSATALPTLRATFTPLSIATLTPTPTSTEIVSTFTPQPTGTAAQPGPTLENTRVTDDSVPTNPPSVTPTVKISSPTPATPTPSPVPPTPTPRPEWLAFETDRGSLGDYEIFVMTSEGARATNLTNSWADDVSPVWSPDGRRIAFVSWRDTLSGKWSLEPGSIYIMDFDPDAGAAGNLVRLTDGTNNDTWPTWAPDGKRIAFQSDRGGDLDIWVINVDGSGLRNLTNNPGRDEHPAWSPDGTKIAFTSGRGANYEVWVMNADGSNPVNLTNAQGRDRYPMWSPDGTKIAFNTKRDGDQEIYIMRADGSNQRNVTNSPHTEGLATWSPDGTRLVLYSDRPGDKDIFILDLGTGQWANISKSPNSDDEFCTWSP
ncbi:MAG TPA: hypothetical protein VLY63_28230 [Anaerolineae bacterium]|nr:hypothetical protein [Anaerolineae bacterium]